MAAINTKPNLKKKMFEYARDFALDKLNKKLDEKLVKQQIRQTNSNRQYERVPSQRFSQVSESIGTSSEFTSSSSSSQMTPLIQSNEKLAGNMKTMQPESSSKKGIDIGRSAISVDSSGQEEDYQTADEDDGLPIKNDVIESVTVSDFTAV